MKINGFLVLGIVLILFGGFSMLDIMDGPNKQYLTLEEWEAAGRPVPIALVRRYWCQKVSFEMGEPSEIDMQCEVPVFSTWSEEKAYAVEHCGLPEGFGTSEYCVNWSIETVYYVVVGADATKPEISSEGPLHPSPKANYTKLEQIYVTVRDAESTIDRVQWTYREKGKPATFISLTYTGPTVIVETKGFPPIPVPVIWEVWGANLTTPITTEGNYSFWFTVYNKAELYEEPSFMSGQNYFTITPEGQDPEDEISDIEDEIKETEEEIEEGTYQYDRSTDTQSRSSTDIAVIFIVVGGLSIFYGFAQKKKKEQT